MAVRRRPQPHDRAHRDSVIGEDLARKGPTAFYMRDRPQWVELRLSMIRPSSGQLLPFGVAAEIFRERPFAPAHRGSGGGGMRGGGTKAARRSISSKGVRNSARSPAELGLVLW